MIPPFNHNCVLPPFSGTSPITPTEISPYKCEILEFCQYFASSPKRIEILKGFVHFRLECIKYGISEGFQWIDGSFIEDVMKREKRDPNDIDVVSFIFNIDGAKENLIMNFFPDFTDFSASKSKYHVDHYVVQADLNPLKTIAGVKYWYQLFSHNRLGIWKGMIEIPFYDNDIKDLQALKFLNSL